MGAKSSTKSKCRKDLLDHLFVGWPQENNNRIQLSKVKPLDLFRSDIQQAVFALKKRERNIINLECCYFTLTKCIQNAIVNTSDSSVENM